MSWYEPAESFGFPQREFRKTDLSSRDYFWRTKSKPIWVSISVGFFPREKAFNVISISRRASVTRTAPLPAWWLECLRLEYVQDLFDRVKLAKAVR